MNYYYFIGLLLELSDIINVKPSAYYLAYSKYLVDISFIIIIMFNR